MASFKSLMYMFSKIITQYINAKETITNEQFKQADIDKWRIWHPCPIHPELWHDDMLKYISFDVSFTYTTPILTMHFIIDGFTLTCTGSQYNDFTHHITFNGHIVETFTLSIAERITPRVINYIEIYSTILNYVFPSTDNTAYAAAAGTPAVTVAL